MRCPECARAAHPGADACRRGLRAGTAPATYALIAINVAAFVAEIAGGASARSTAGARSSRDGGLFGPARRERRLVADRHRRLPARRASCTSRFNMYVLYILGQPARAGDRHAALPRRLLRLAARRLVRRPAAEPERAHGRRLGRDLRPDVGRASSSPATAGSSSSPAQIGFFIVINLVLHASASRTSASEATSAGWSAGRSPGC